MTHATEKNGNLVHYVIRDIPSGKYYRHPKYPINAEYLNLVSGINRAMAWIDNDKLSFTRSIICRYGLTDCEIVACYEHENYKKGRLYNREIKGVVS